jgi:D-glycero-D-manno-heptose 1,7-bisphosphate phosphatase
MTKILFLDLDGTVRKTKSGATFINDPYDQELIPGVEEAIARYHDYKIIGVTNQGGVKAGFKSLENCFEEQRQTLKLLPQMNLLLFCTDDGNTMFRFSQQGLKMHGIAIPCNAKKYGNFRKPNPGMIVFGMIVFGMKYSYSRENPEEVLMVGDRAEDQECAKNANIPFMWAEEWRNGK